MVTNRSVPTNTMLPHLVYQDIAQALDWLSATFGFTEHYRYGEPEGTFHGAWMHLGDAWIQLGIARAGGASPAWLGHRTQSLTVFVADVAAHFERVASAGAEIVEELNVTAYGERQYGVEDLEGHQWLFSRRVRDVSPDEWGVAVSGRSGVSSTGDGEP